MKLFKTNNIEIVELCQYQFGFVKPSLLWKKRVGTFNVKFDTSDNAFCKLTSQYSTVVLTVVRVMIAKYRKSGIWGYRSSLTPEPIELK